MLRETDNLWTVRCFRKNMQRNKQVAMGRKKFNMDPKKVGGSNVVVLQKCDLSYQYVTTGPVSVLGDPIPHWEWLAEKHQRRHCSVPLQGRGPQQNGHRRLPRREVRTKIVAFLFHTHSLSYSLSVATTHPPIVVDKSISSQSIFSILLCFPLVQHTPILLHIDPTFRSSSQDNVQCSKATIWLQLSYSYVTWLRDF